MRILDKHIGATVLLSIVIVAVIVLGLDLLFAFIDELDDVEGSYGAMDALVYTLFTLPRRLYDLLPLAALIGSLIGLGTLASNSELTVMRAAGVSITRIVMAVFKPVLVVLLTGVLLGEYAAPRSENMAESRRAIAQGTEQAFKSRGFWHREGNDFLHINAVQLDGALRGITRYRFDDKRRLLEASFASKAIVEDDSWLMENVQTTRFPEPDRSEVGLATQERWNVLLSAELLQVVVLDPGVLPLSGIWHYQRYLAEQGLSNEQYRLAFWKKLFQPLATLALVFVAISFVFGPLRSVTLGQRVFTGVLVGFSFRMVQDLLGPSSLVFGFSPLIAVLAPMLLLFLLGAWLMRRAG
jgi:lipopolysaccharide export system permease protein